MMLLLIALFGDKIAAGVHLRWFPFVDRINDLRGYSRGSAVLAWLYRSLCRATNRNVVQLWGRYSPTSDEKDPRVIQHRRQLDRMTFREGPFHLDRPTYILRVHRVVASCRSGDPTVWRRSECDVYAS
ncbi:hypothetical protein PIB30_091036 [Stylosanthes scabra]|uniref:Uncharacterized protein n=1 Tax=Stylosanthes scabra TaxID=79078 RepID=A0ABU6UT81_9FABA|nr:hypothetical protein [Stylosanthes scabra]